MLQPPADETRRTTATPCPVGARAIEAALAVRSRGCLRLAWTCSRCSPRRSLCGARMCWELWPQIRESDLQLAHSSQPATRAPWSGIGRCPRGGWERGLQLAVSVTSLPMQQRADPQLAGSWVRQPPSPSVTTMRSSPNRIHAPSPLQASETVACKRPCAARPSP